MVTTAMTDSFGDAHRGDGQHIESPADVGTASPLMGIRVCDPRKRWVDAFG
jgi:hypothetical protein